jgi:hypothetical protein
VTITGKVFSVYNFMQVGFANKIIFTFGSFAEDEWKLSSCKDSDFIPFLG